MAYICEECGKAEPLANIRACDDGYGIWYMHPACWRQKAIDPDSLRTIEWEKFWNSYPNPYLLEAQP